MAPNPNSARFSASTELWWQLGLDINSVRIGVHAAGLDIVPDLLIRYGAFLTDAPPRWAMHLDLCAEQELPRRKAWIRHDEAVTRFEVDTYAGSMNFASGEATVRVVNSTHAISGLERVAAYICLQELPRYHSSLLIHGAGIIIGEKGYVFFGPSGRGKSTVANLAAPVGEILSDELVIADMSGHTPMLVGTPFWGTGTPTARVASTRYRRVPLRALYELHHGTGFHIESLSLGQGIMALLASEKVATERVSSADHWLAVAERVVQASPVQHLDFYPSPDIWSFLALENYERRTPAYGYHSDA